MAKHLNGNNYHHVRPSWKDKLIKNMCEIGFPSQIHLMLGMPALLHTVAKIPCSYQEVDNFDLPA